MVAEGIEAKEQVEMLRKMGCDLIQGYVYSKPLPVGELSSGERSMTGNSIKRLCPEWQGL